MPTYLVWNENQSCRSSAHARQTRHTQTQANLEPECQSLGLHRLPNQTNTIRIRTANRWAYVHILTHKQINKQTHTKRKKVPGETSHGLLPTYLVWNEDQGDVVPLKGKG